MNTKNTMQTHFDALMVARDMEAKRDMARRITDGTVETKMTLQQYAEHTAWAKKAFAK